jgi:hypothetical protein
MVHCHATAEPNDAAGSNEKFAAPRPQMVDAQVDGADIRKLPPISIPLAAL